MLFVVMLTAFDLSPGHPVVTRTAAAAVLIAVWWITEALPIPVTSLLPLVLFPLLGIMKTKEIAPSYMNSSIFLFMGGFMIALSIERWGLHRRIALNILRLLGDNPRKLILGFMVATAILSMWISNTATTMMMLPIALAVAHRADRVEADGGFKVRFPLALMLAIAYSASIGGIGTLIGTPPNIVFSRQFLISFPGAPQVSFLQWLQLAFPLVVVFIVVTWFLLTRVLVPVPNVSFGGGREMVKDELAGMGPTGVPERRVAVIFALTALLWITRSKIDLGFVSLPGWADLTGLGSLVDDGTVAVMMAVLLFALPAGNRSGERLLDWGTALKLPWGILLLFGGGFALATGFKTSGLSAWVGGQLHGLAGQPPGLMVGLTSTMLTFLTELTSNTATTQLILPILASIAAVERLHPLLLMIPATISASCAFMLPVATPPNAIVFSSGRVPIAKMATVGIVLNVVGVVLVTALVIFVGGPLFDLFPSVLPQWVVPAP